MKYQKNAMAVGFLAVKGCQKKADIILLHITIVQMVIFFQNMMIYTLEGYTIR